MDRALYIMIRHRGGNHRGLARCGVVREERTTFSSEPCEITRFPTFKLQRVPYSFPEAKKTTAGLHASLRKRMGLCRFGLLYWSCKSHGSKIILIWRLRRLRQWIIISLVRAVPTAVKSTYLHIKTATTANNVMTQRCNWIVEHRFSHTISSATFLSRGGGKTQSEPLCHQRKSKCVYSCRS